MHESLRHYLASMGLRLDADVSFWQDELMRYPLSSVAHSFTLSVARKEIFDQISREISVLLEAEQHQTD